MTKDIVMVLFDDISSVHRAIAELADAGISLEQISIMASDTSNEYRGFLAEDQDDTYDGSQGRGDVMETGAGAASGLPGSLVKLDVPEEHAVYYTEGVRRGGTLMAIKAGEGMQNRVREILNRHEPVDIEERAVAWREEGWTGLEETHTWQHENTAKEETREVRQEEGWVKEPETSTRMRESRVSEKDKIDRETTTGPGYIPDKKPSEKELIDQDLANFRGSGNYDYDRYAGRFKKHYEEKLSGHGHDYVYFEPAYRYGYGLGMVRSDRRWDAFEKEVRDEWNQNHEDTWEDFKDAIRYAWEEVNKERQ